MTEDVLRKFDHREDARILDRVSRSLRAASPADRARFLELHLVMLTGDGEDVDLFNEYEGLGKRIFTDFGFLDHDDSTTDTEWGVDQLLAEFADEVEPVRLHLLAEEVMES